MTWNEGHSPTRWRASASSRLAERGTSDPAWSPDGSRIAYVTAPRQANGRSRFSFDVWSSTRRLEPRAAVRLAVLQRLAASAVVADRLAGAFANDTPGDLGSSIIANVADPGGIVERAPYERVADRR